MSKLRIVDYNLSAQIRLFRREGSLALERSENDNNNTSQNKISAHVVYITISYSVRKIIFRVRKHVVLQRKAVSIYGCAHAYTLLYGRVHNLRADATARELSRV